MRLEELLRTYPPEAVERRRYEKIARALGTRTTQQVQHYVMGNTLFLIHYLVFPEDAVGMKIKF